MKKSGFAALVAVAMLTMFVLSCGVLPREPTLVALPPTPTATTLPPTSMPPTATPQVMQTNYTNDSTGVSMWYPEGWVYGEYLQEVIFASSPDIIANSELATGAALMLSIRELDGGQTIERLVETTLAELSFQYVVTSDPKPRSIGGQQGILITLKGTAQGAPFPMRGFLAGTGVGERGYLFLAVSVADQWSELGPLMEGMLESVCFESIEPTYSSASLGLSLRYPEGWVYDELGDQVIFGSSEETISGAELQSGAAMLVVRSEMEEGLTLEAMFQMMVTEMPFGPLETSDPERRTIGGEDAIIMTFAGTPEGAPLPMKGFLAGAAHEGWSYLFLGISALDRWCDYGPAVESMLDSVQFKTEQR